MNSVSARKLKCSSSTRLGSARLGSARAGKFQLELITNVYYFWDFTILHVISPRGPFIFILENKCNGYTWHGKLSNRISNVCVLFDTTSPDGSYECSNCISGQIDDIEENCNCQKQYGGECLITNDNFLSAIVAYSDLECFIQCSATDGCLFYTWYRSVEFLLVIFNEIDAKFHQLNQKVMTFSILRNYFGDNWQRHK